MAQAVPEHVGSEGEDQYESFLPLRSTSVAGGFRAVVFVPLGAKKGTRRSPQEYEARLLMLSGREYEVISFAQLHGRLCDAIRAGRPRVIGEIFLPDGRVKIAFDDGSFRYLPETG
jgi:hypothetical protein